MSIMNHDYSFRLTPYTGYVKELCGVKSYDFNIYDDSDSEIGSTDMHVLTSPHLNIISDPIELAKKLKGLLMILNGSLSILIGFERHYSRGFLSIDYSDGIEFSSISDFNSLDITQANPFNFHGINKPHTDANHLSRLVNLSSKYEDLRIVLGLCGMEYSWVNLYRIWETISFYVRKHYIEGKITIPNPSKKLSQAKQIISQAFRIDEREISRFTGTANSFEMLGFLARHGRGQHSVINDPMTRLEASIFVHRAARTFCNIYLL